MFWSVDRWVYCLFARAARSEDKADDSVEEGGGGYREQLPQIVCCGCRQGLILAQQSRLELQNGRVVLNGRDVTEHLRTREVESQVSAVSALSFVRAAMRDLQRAVAQQGPVVAEGRDMGSVVFPMARWKVYLDAAPSERARRRCQDFARQGREVSEALVLEEILVRDRLDSTRSDAPLRQAADAIYIDSTGLTTESVVAQLFARVRGDDVRPLRETPVRHGQGGDGREQTAETFGGRGHGVSCRAPRVRESAG